MAVPLVLLPGLMCDRAVWGGVMEALPPETDIDVAAYGDIDSLGEMAARALMLAPPRFALAGHSMGGRVAFEVFRRAPERVAGLALLDTNYKPRPAGDAGEREARERGALLAIAERSGTRAMARDWVANMVHPSADMRLVETIVEMFGRKSAGTFAAQIRALLARPDAAPLLGTIRCPALILCGREDSWSPPARHEEMAAAISGSTLAVIDACGHMAPMERPREVAAALREWLARVEKSVPAAAQQRGLS